MKIVRLVACTLLGLLGIVVAPSKAVVADTCPVIDYSSFGFEKTPAANWKIVNQFESSRGRATKRLFTLIQFLLSFRPPSRLGCKRRSIVTAKYSTLSLSKKSLLRILQTL
jgi:hypothetical protein